MKKSVSVSCSDVQSDVPAPAVGGEKALELADRHRRLLKDDAAAENQRLLPANDRKRVKPREQVLELLLRGSDVLLPHRHGKGEESVDLLTSSREVRERLRGAKRRTDTLREPTTVCPNMARDIPLFTAASGGR